MGSSCVFLMRGLITANLKVLGTYPNDNDTLIIAKRGSMTSGSSSFSSLDGIGSNIHVVGLDQWFSKCGACPPGGHTSIAGGARAISRKIQ